MKAKPTTNNRNYAVSLNQVKRTAFLPIFYVSFLLFLFSCLITPAQNNMTIQWQGCYGGRKYDNAGGIVQTNNGCIVIGTTDGDVPNSHGSDDIWLISLDSLGNLLWERAYGGSNTEYATNIIKDDFGYYYFGGWVSSNDGDVQSGTHGGYDRWVVKIDIQGNIIWERCYGGSFVDYGGMLKSLNNGNILVYGATTSSDGDVPINYGFLDNWLMIINTDGDIIESRVYGNMDQNNIFDIVETSDGGFFFASKTNVAQGMVQGEPHGLTDVWVVKLDNEMNIEWQKLYGGSKDEYGYRGVMELDDGYIFLSYTNSNDYDVSGYHGIPGESRDIWVVRIDTIGNILWQRCLGGSNWDASATINQSEDGGFVIFAETKSNDGDVSGNTSYSAYYDIWMVKLSADGELEWQECYGGLGNERVNRGVLKKSEHNWVIAGRASHNSGDVDCTLHGDEDFWIFEIKDCSQYQPATPQQPTGQDTLCVNTDSITTYTTTAASGAWAYEWEFTPEEAGTLEPDSLTAQIHWNPLYEGPATIKVRSTNDCGESAWSDSLVVQTHMCLGTKEYEDQMPVISVYPNPADNMLYVKCYKLNAGSLTSVEVLDSYGRLIHQSTLPNGSQQATVNVTGWSKGLYLVRVMENGKVVGGRKVVVE